MPDLALHRKDAALDGLRGLAALAVVFSHCFFGFFPYTHTGAPEQLRYEWERWLFNTPLYFLYSGGFAVSLFFVLSGYVLSRKFFEGADIDYLRGAAFKRYFRLGIPVFASVMMGYLLITCRAFPHIPASLPSSFAWDSYHGASSLIEALSQGIYGSLFFGRTSYDYVLWTIQLEFYGSLFLFGFLALFGKGRYSGLSAAVAILVLMTISQNPGTYFAMFIIGAYINRSPAFFRRPWFTLPALLLGLFISAYKPNAPLYLPLVAAANNTQTLTGLAWNWPVVYEAIAAWLIVTAILGSPLAHRVLSTPIIAWTGKVSFSVYLIHTMILGSVGASVYKHTLAALGYEYAAFTAIAAVFACTLLIAEPFRRIFDARAIRVASAVGRLAYKAGASGSP
jgi:peptidoglycan/LPS O-acetylase OafA/YrhL